MMSNQNKTVCVCVLAHNEEKNIAQTLSAICAVDGSNNIPVYVYANGCTDRTCEIVTIYASSHSNVHLRELSVASKPGAWNTAFSECLYDIIIFADGDIVPDAGGVMQLVNELSSFPQMVIASCRQVPMDSGLSLQQKFVGFMQIPLVQTFLAGGFYAVQRLALAELMSQNGFAELPPGVAGEDAFLYYIVGPERLIVSESCSAYVPPDLKDYGRYLSRIRWQNEQIRFFWKHIMHEQSSIAQIITKLRMCRSYRRLPVAILAVATRYLFKLATSSQLKREYEKLGPVRANGAEILSNSTRSLSTK